MIKKLFDATIPLRTRFFWIFIIACIFGNTIGFLGNAIFYGMYLGTSFCGLCDLLIIATGFYGIKSGRNHRATFLILFIVNFIEFPGIYYLFGKCSIIYMLLGVVAIIIFLDNWNRIAMVLATVTIDISTIILSVKYDKQVYVKTNAEEIGAMMCSYLIFTVIVFFVIQLLEIQYKKQTKRLVEISKELENLSNQDPLTGLYNRRYLSGTLQNLIKKENPCVYVALLDLDNFKQINDRYGHVIGDEVLVLFSNIVKQEIKEIGFAARYGGEEFMLVFENVSYGILENVLVNVKNRYEKETFALHGEIFTFSGGIEKYDHETEIVKLFDEVDEKLYQAKTMGKSQIQGMSSGQYVVS